MILFKFCKNYLHRIIRHIFWLIKHIQSDYGKHVSIVFPVVREGKGKVKLGDNCVLGRRSHLCVGINGVLEVGNQAIIESESKIVINRSFKLLAGNNFKLGASTRLFVNNNWVIGNGVKIETNCAIFSREPEGKGQLIIGDNTHIGDFTIIDLVHDVYLGNDVAIGPNCTLYTHDHEYSCKDLPAWKGGIISKPIVIEDGAWVGANVTILPGITIGRRAVIATGSVVTKNVPDESIYGGVPAKLIKTIEHRKSRSLVGNY